MKLTKLLEDVTSAPTTGDASRVDETPRTYQSVVAGTGAVSATVAIEGSNDDSNWVELGTCTLSGITSDTSGFGSVVPWFYTRATLMAISGTDAAVNVTMGV